jgi:hypothetical protein
MVRLISLNTRKRLGVEHVRRIVAYWLEKHGCDIFVAQEPFAKEDSVDIDTGVSYGCQYEVCWRVDS